MNIKVHIDYGGSSKVIRRLCDIINYMAEYASGDMMKTVYDTNENGVVDNAEKVNNHAVYADVPTDAKFTDTIYDDSSINMRVKANTNNVTLIMQTLFNAETDYLMDSKGNVIIGSDGIPLYTARYYSKLADIQASITALQTALAALGLQVVDGKLNTVYTKGSEG